MNKRIITEIVINASREKVWDILTGFHHYPSWNPFIIRIDGELAKGKRLTNTLFNGKKTFVFRPRVLSVVPYQYFDWLGSLFMRGLFDGHHYFEIEELAPSQVKLIQGEHFSGLLSSYILKKIGEDTRSSFVMMNRAVKALAENRISIG
jgi:hypothetical protein